MANLFNLSSKVNDMSKLVDAGACDVRIDGADGQARKLPEIWANGNVDIIKKNVQGMVIILKDDTVAYVDLNCAVIDRKEAGIYVRVRGIPAEE